MLVTIEKVLSLKQLPLFKTVSNMALSDLMAVSEEKTIKKAELLISATEQNHNVYFLLSGSVEVSYANHKETISAPAFIGLESVFLQASAGKDITIKQTSVVLQTQYDKLYRMMALHPSLATAILHELSAMIQK